jgi:chitosanase
MGFSERDKLKALAIVHIFETSKPFGEYSAVAVLNDGAGISYGINQFTHRSKSLFAVIQRFVKLGGELPDVVERVWDSLRSGTQIGVVSGSGPVKQALARLGANPLMQQAQREIAFENYLKPALEAAEGSDFQFPLSLAVIYDSINHGSYDKIRDKVVVNRPGNGSMKEEEFERLWISKYVQKRDAWLESVPRLAATDYRTDFFLAQLARGNWNLNLPVNVHGYKLTDVHIDAMLPERSDEWQVTSDEGIIDPAAAEPRQDPQSDPLLEGTHHQPDPQSSAADPPAEAPSQTAENIVNVGDQPTVPANFVPEDKTVDAPQPTNFLGKLKAQIAALGIGTGTIAVIKEWTGLQLTAETVELLKYVVPTILSLGFLGFLVWFVTTKIVGWKTLRLQAEIETNPLKHNLRIRPQ